MIRRATADWSLRRTTNSEARGAAGFARDSAVALQRFVMCFHLSHKKLAHLF